MLRPRSAKFYLVTTTAIISLISGYSRLVAFEQSPTNAHEQRQVDVDKYSAAAKAAEVNKLGDQHGAPSFGDGRAATGETGSENQAGKGIPGGTAGIDNSTGGASRLNTTAAGQQNGVKEVPGFDASGGAVDVNLPGSTPQHSIGDVDKALAELRQAGSDLVDKANQGVQVNVTGDSKFGGNVSDNDQSGSNDLVNQGKPVAPNSPLASNGLVNFGKPVGSPQGANSAGGSSESPANAKGGETSTGLLRPAVLPAARPALTRVVLASGWTSR